MQNNILVAGDSFAHCDQQVQKFFDLTTLVMYDYIKIRKHTSVSGSDSRFFEILDQAQQKNREFAQKLITEISQTGIKTTEDIINIDQGYLSKTFHLLSHILDGFIGIDSHFYNLLDDSHWLSQETRKLIENNPEHYWLLHVDGFTASPAEASLLHS